MATLRRAPATDDQRIEPAVEGDLVLLMEACTAAFDARVLGAVRAAVGAHVRFSDGYVFQHLLAGPLAVTELAHRLGVTQQAASKQVADMEDRGLVRRRSDPTDRRARPEEISPRGRRTVDADRTARVAIATEVADVLGRTRSAALVAALAEVGEATGALDEMRGRRLRPESSR